MKKKKKNIKLLVRRTLIILVPILVILVFINSFSKSNIKRNSKTVFEIGNKVIKLDNELIIDDNKNLYLSYEDIKNNYDENIFYDEANKKLITTYNKHIAILELDKNNIEINDASSNIKGKLQYLNDVLYLPFSDMKMVYDFEYSYSDKTNIVMVDSISNEKKTGKLIRAAKIKKKPSLFSKKLVKLQKEKELVIFEENDNYYSVRTNDGIIVYALKNRFGDINIVREKMEDTTIKDVNILSNYSNMKETYEVLNLDNKKYNVVALDLLELEKDKEINLKVSTSGDNYKKYMEWVEKSNVNVWANLDSSVEISDVMLTYDDRKEIINNIYLALVENNFKVLNINFEKINDINSFYRFIIEITPKLKEAGIKTVVTYNESMNEEKVSKIVDYVIKEEK